MKRKYKLKMSLFLGGKFGELIHLNLLVYLITFLSLHFFSFGNTDKNVYIFEKNMENIYLKSL